MVYLLSRSYSLYLIIFNGVLFPFSGFNKTAVDENGDVAVYYCLRNAGALADLCGVVARVAYYAGEDYALDGVKAFDGADDAFVEADGQEAGKGGFFARERLFFLSRRNR